MRHAAKETETESGGEWLRREAFVQAWAAAVVRTRMLTRMLTRWKVVITKRPA